MTDENEVVVERQYRYPVAEVLTEIPAGKLNSKQEDRLAAAKRELREETGITADFDAEGAEGSIILVISTEATYMKNTQGKWQKCGSTEVIV